jgi:hypothetical protein
MRCCLRFRWLFAGYKDRMAGIMYNMLGRRSMGWGKKNGGGRVKGRASWIGGVWVSMIGLCLLDRSRGGIA